MVGTGEKNSCACFYLFLILKKYIVRKNTNTLFCLVPYSKMISTCISQCYQNFYSSIFNEVENDTFFQKVSSFIPKTNKQAKTFCEKSLSFEELDQVIKLPKSKSPSPGGLLFEVY